MKKKLTTLIVTVTLAYAASAQDRIYRCGNEYTNNPNVAKERNCKLVEGGNVTVVPGSRVAPAGAASSSGAPRVDNNEQRARDADARAILDSELRKAEARHAELVKEYNNGEPERDALGLRNPQRHMERTAELKASIARSESDIAGIRRELGRIAPSANTK